MPAAPHTRRYSRHPSTAYASSATRVLTRHRPPSSRGPGRRGRTSSMLAGLHVCATGALAAGSRRHCEGSVPARHDPSRHHERRRARGRHPGRRRLRRQPAQHLLLHRQRHLSAVGMHAARCTSLKGGSIGRGPLLRGSDSAGCRDPRTRHGRERRQQRGDHQPDLRPDRLLAVRILQHPDARRGLQRDREPRDLHRRLRDWREGRPHRDRRASTASLVDSVLVEKFGRCGSAGAPGPRHLPFRRLQHHDQATASSGATPRAASRCTHGRSRRPAHNITISGQLDLRERSRRLRGRHRDQRRQRRSRTWSSRGTSSTATTTPASASSATRMGSVSIGPEHVRLERCRFDLARDPLGGQPRRVGQRCGDELHAQHLQRRQPAHQQLLRLGRRAVPPSTTTSSTARGPLRSGQLRRAR